MGKKPKGFVKGLIEYIKENPGKDLREKNVAALFQVSESTLRHHFKQQLGVAYHEFVETQRMAKAYQLLVEEGMLVKEAMYMTGYRNRSTFIRAFKKHFNTTPSSKRFTKYYPGHKVGNG